MSFQTRLMAEGAQPVYFITAQPEAGRASWYYLRLRPGKQAMFLAVAARGAMDLAEYGEVLASGFGERAPGHVVLELQAQGVI